MMGNRPATPSDLKRIAENRRPPKHVQHDLAGDRR
jgi:hypothetical protein